eukprot:gene5061-7065_t
MVRRKFSEIDQSYNDIKQQSCGRQACTVMIFVAYEPDAMASTRMLTQLLRNDNIAYSIRPIINLEDMQHTYRSYLTQDIKTIILVNCGAIYNIPKLFDLDRGGDVRCFILDNHRPIHLSNIYSNFNVVVFDGDDELAIEEDDNIPSDDSDISLGDEMSIKDSSDDEDEDNEDDSNLDEDEDELDVTKVDAGYDEDASHVEDDQEDHDEELFPSEDIEKESSTDSRDQDEDQDADEDIEENDSRSDDSQLTDPENQVQNDTTIIENYGQENIEEENENNVTRNVNDEESINNPRVDRQHSFDDSHDIDPSKSPVIPDHSRDSLGFDEGGHAGHDDSRDPLKEEEEEEEVKVLGRKRKNLAEIFDPKIVRRRKLHAYYRRNATYAAPTSFMLMQLVLNKLGRGNHIPLDLIWQSIIGVADQYNRGNVTNESYDEYCGYLKDQLANHLLSSADRVRYTVGEGDQEVVVPGAYYGHIEEGPDYRFFMYRHWSLFESMSHSPYIASKLSVWHSQGTIRLQEMLAKMGVPLQQCKQSYQFMSPALRDHFRIQINDKGIKEEYALKNPDVTYKSFFRYNSFKNPIAACDIAYAASSLLEMYGIESFREYNNKINNLNNNTNNSNSNDNNNNNSHNHEKRIIDKISSVDAFNEAYDCMGMKVEELVKKGIKSAIDLQKIIVKKAAVMLDGHDSLLRLNRLYYAYIKMTTTTSISINDSDEGMEMEHVLGRPFVIKRLGHFIMDIKRNIHRRNGGWSGSALLPLIILAERKNSYLVVGISPLSNSTVGSLEGITEEHKQFFKLAAEDIKATIRSNSFDTDVIEIDKNDAQDFLGTLDYVLKKATPQFNR